MVLLSASSELLRPAALRRELDEGEASRWRWLIARARATDFPEWKERARHAWRMEIDVRARKPPRARWPMGRDRVVSPSKPTLLSKHRAELVRAEAESEVAQTLRAADRLVQGRFTLLGYPEVHLARPIDFRNDPFTNRSWPLRHGMKIDYRVSETGDPKWIWELNRLQHLQLLVCAWKLSDDPSFRDVACGDLRTWLEHARPGIGIGWSNGFEPALRAISLSLVVDALREGSHEPELISEATDAIADHLAWIWRYPSLHSSANNHRVAELVALVVAMNLVPELHVGVRFERSLEELRGLCGRLVLEDGGYAERSFSYGLLVTDLLLLVAACLPSRTIGEWVCPLLGRLSDAIATQVDADGSEPDYGDRDDGRAIILDGSPTRATVRVCAALVAAVGHSGAKWVSREADATALWLFGQAGQDRFESTRPQRPSSSVWLKHTGLAVLRTARTTVRFDLGDIGLPPLAAHGHADALQVGVVFDGQTLIGDPGTGSYFGSRAIREAFRGTGFHATVLVDGSDQAVSGGPFLWMTRAEVRPHLIDLTRRVAAGSHTGYCRLPDPVRHFRSVKLLKDGLVVVVDQLVADGEHQYIQRWPIDPQNSVEILDDKSCRAVGRATFTITVRATCPFRASHDRGSLHPFLGWWSPKLEAIQPADLVSFEAGPVRSCRMLTVISAGEHPPTVLGSPRTEVELRVDGRRYSVRWPTRAEAPVYEERSGGSA